MTDPKTESRAVARWTRDAEGWVEWPDGEWVRYSDHTTALAAKDAELAGAVQEIERLKNLVGDPEGTAAHAETFLARAERAEAQLAEARKALDALDRMSRGLDWCDQDEQARRWSAARRALEGGQADG